MCACLLIQFDFWLEVLVCVSACLSTLNFVRLGCMHV